MYSLIKANHVLVLIEEMLEITKHHHYLIILEFHQKIYVIIYENVYYIYCGIINALGLPSTQCPLGLDSEQLPLGMQCVAGRGHDKLCLAVAQEIEKAMGGWISPSRVTSP